MTILENDQSGPKSMFGNLPVTSRYAFGLGGERFFRAIKEEARILGTHCANCNRLYLPGVIFCERCMDSLDDWVDVGTTGTIHTFTVLDKSYNGMTLEQPELIAFVKIGDGGIVHRLSGIQPDEIEIGMQVKAAFKQEQEREGSITDILYFTPV